MGNSWLDERCEDNKAVILPAPANFCSLDCQRTSCERAKYCWSFLVRKFRKTARKTAIFLYGC
jgi:hypothetical protein